MAVGVEIEHLFLGWRSSLRNLTCYWTRGARSLLSPPQNGRLRLDMSKDGCDFEACEASEELYEQVSCCHNGYLKAGDEQEEDVSQKLNSRTMVVPSRNLSL